MNSSSTHIHVNPSSPKDAFPNVINFRFIHLRKYKSYKKVKGEPKKCAGCDAVLLNNWTCRFCNTENDTNCELPESNDVGFILEQEDNNENARYIVFCLDISGSMKKPVLIDKFVKLPTDEINEKRYYMLSKELSYETGEYISFEEKHRFGLRAPEGKRLVTRLDMLKTGVINNLENIQYENENAKVAIVTFNNEVCIVGDGLIDKVILNDEAMNSKSSIETLVRSIDRIKYIGLNPGLLINKVLEFENKGQTALGPALYASVLLACRRRRSIVILFTDGLANIGLGNLKDESQIEESKNFYKEIGHIADRNGVTVSIAAVKGENCKLNVLKYVAINSGGQIFTADPANLNDIEFDFNQTTSILVTLATNVNLTILVPKGLIIKDSKNEHSNSNILTKKIGNVTKKTEIAFEIVGTSECRNLIGTEIPIQLELTYKSDEGSDVVRVIRIYREVTEDAKLVEKNTDRCILGSYLIRTVADSKTASDEFVSLALTINEIQTEIEDKFDREKYFREVRNVGIDLGGDYSNNQDSNDDSTFALKNKSLKMTSDDLRKKNIEENKRFKK